MLKSSAAAAAAAAAAASAAESSSAAAGESSEDDTDSSDDNGSGWGAVGQSKRGRQGFKVSFNLGGSMRKTATAFEGVDAGAASSEYPEEVTGRSPATVPAPPGSKDGSATKRKGASSSSSNYVLGHVDLSRKFKRMLGGTKTKNGFASRRGHRGSKHSASRLEYSDAASDDAISGLALGNTDFASDDEDTELESYITRTKAHRLKRSKSISSPCSSSSSSSSAVADGITDVGTKTNGETHGEEGSDQSEDPLHVLLQRRKVVPAPSSSSSASAAAAPAAAPTTTNAAAAPAPAPAAASSFTAKKGAKLPRTTPLHSKPSRAKDAPDAPKLAAVTATPARFEKVVTSSPSSKTEKAVAPHKPVVAAKEVKGTAPSDPLEATEKTTKVVSPKSAVAAKAAKKVASFRPTVLAEKSASVEKIESTEPTGAAEKGKTTTPPPTFNMAEKAKSTATSEPVVAVAKQVASLQPEVSTQKAKKVATPEHAISAEKAEKVVNPGPTATSEKVEEVAPSENKRASSQHEVSIEQMKKVASPASMLAEEKAQNVASPEPAVKIAEKAKSVPSHKPVLAAVEKKSKVDLFDSGEKLPEPVVAAKKARKVKSAEPALAAKGAKTISFPELDGAKSSAAVNAVVHGRSAPSPVRASSDDTAFPAIPRPTSITRPAKADETSKSRHATPLETSTKSPAEIAMEKSGTSSTGPEKGSMPGKVTADRIQSQRTQTENVEKGTAPAAPVTKARMSAAAKAKRKKRAGVPKATIGEVVAPIRADSTKTQASTTVPSYVEVDNTPSSKTTIDTRLFSTDRMAQKIVPKPSTQKGAVRKKSKKIEASALGDSKVGTPPDQKKADFTTKVNVESVPSAVNGNVAKPLKKAPAVKRSAAPEPLAAKDSAAPEPFRVSPSDSPKPKPGKSESKGNSLNSQAAKDLAAKLSGQASKKNIRPTQSSGD